MGEKAKFPYPWRAILAPGRNCWTSEAIVDASGLLIDGRNYYRALWQVAGQARRSILICGWRFNSDVRLLRGPDAEKAGGEVRFLPFLKRLCEENRQLRIYILAWDFSLSFAWKWELFQEQKFSDVRGQMRFLFDDQHPIGGSHHQKFAVIDRKAAFVGGLDIDAQDWDDRRHLAHHPDRADSGEGPHPAYHDLQAYLVGPAADELARYFQFRWRKARGGALELPPPDSLPPPQIRPSVPLAARRVALSHNYPMTFSDPGSARQIRQLYLDAIAAADELIYLENQYFSSQAVCQALIDRMKAPGRPRLEIVLVLPKRLPAWTESVAVGPRRIRILDELRQAGLETGHRLGVYYPVAAGGDGPEVPVLVHSKLLSVDDRFLTVGSCNAANRSMGLDTELNVAWEASSPEQRELARSIRRLRVSLLTEHCGLWRRGDLRRQLRQAKGLVARLDRLAAEPSCRLRPLTPEAIADDRPWLKLLKNLGLSLDPGRPYVDELLYEHLAPASGSPLARGAGGPDD